MPVVTEVVVAQQITGGLAGPPVAHSIGLPAFTPRSGRAAGIRALSCFVPARAGASFRRGRRLRGRSRRRLLGRRARGLLGRDVARLDAAARRFAHAAAASTNGARAAAAGQPPGSLLAVAVPNVLATVGGKLAATGRQAVRWGGTSRRGIPAIRAPTPTTSRTARTIAPIRTAGGSRAHQAANRHDRENPIHRSHLVTPLLRRSPSTGPRFA